MGKEFIKLLEQMVSPGKTWDCWARKALSTLLAACCGVLAFQGYERLQRSHWEDLPLHTAIQKEGVAEQVQLYLDRLVREHGDHLEAVWVYSWPDARTLTPVAHAGFHVNPMPLGYFRVSDASPVGQLVMEQCAEIDRQNKTLTACPIMAENDAWGVVIFQCTEDSQRPDRWRSIYATLAHKLSYIIYHTN